jgi:hypothetical protein
VVAKDLRGGGEGGGYGREGAEEVVEMHCGGWRSALILGSRQLIS